MIKTLAAALMIAASASAQDAAKRTPVTAATLPGTYKTQVAFYAVTITVRADATFSFESSAAGKTSRFDGAWTLDGQAFSGKGKLENGEEATIGIDLTGVCVEDLEKTAAVKVTSSRLGDKPLTLRVTRSGPAADDQTAARKPKADPLGELRTALDALAAKCLDGLCKGADALKRKARELEIEKKLKGFERLFSKNEY